MARTKALKGGNPGSRWLTPSDKANIVIEKELRGVSGKSTEDIAVEFGVAKGTVVHMTANNIPAEAKKIYKKKRKRLDELAMEATEAALIKGKELIEQAADPKHLSGIAALGKMADTVYRLETNKPTEIQATMPAETHALDFIKMLMARMDQAAAMEAFLRANLEPLIPEARKIEIHRRIQSGELKLLTA